MKLKPPFKIFSTFTGGGGLDIGFHGGFTFLNKQYKKLPFQTITSIDINPDACLTLSKSKYFPKTNIICDDITNHSTLDYQGEEWDVLLGGFPCVTFSIVGKQAGVTDDIHGKLYETYARFVEDLRPKVFLAENVKGILSANNGEAVKIIKKRFEIDGYTLKVFLVNFADFGVPQLRERVLFLGIRDDVKTEFIPPEFSNKGNHVTAQEAFENIDLECENSIASRILPKTALMLASIPEGGNFSDAPEELRIKALMSNVYRRLERDKPAYTVIASGGGGTWTYHWSENRALTNRERARLQGFPDNHKFKGSIIEARRQIGNAVPSVGIHAFAERISNMLNGVVPKYDKENCIKELKIEKSKLEIK